METEFDFTKTNNKYVYKFNSNMAHIIRLNHSFTITYYIIIVYRCIRH